MRWCSFRWLLAVVILALTVDGGTPTTDVLCNDAVSQLVPCGPFLKSKAAAPSVTCCGAVKSLDKKATASPDYQKGLCECFKEIANSFPINLGRAHKLPKLCNATQSVKIGPDISCNILTT